MALTEGELPAPSGGYGSQIPSLQRMEPDILSIRSKAAVMILALERAAETGLEPAQASALLHEMIAVEAAVDHVSAAWQEAVAS